MQKEEKKSLATCLSEYESKGDQNPWPTVQVLSSLVWLPRLRPQTYKATSIPESSWWNQGLARQPVRPGTAHGDASFVSSAPGKAPTTMSSSYHPAQVHGPHPWGSAENTISTVYQWNDFIFIIQDCWLNFSFPTKKKLFLAGIYWELLILQIKGIYIVA